MGGTQKVRVSRITRANDALEGWMPLTKAKVIVECEEMSKVDAFLEDYHSTGDGNYQVYTWEEAVAARIIVLQSTLLLNPHQRAS